MNQTETPCEFIVEGYGPCGRPADHIVHRHMGISEREHDFTRAKSGIKETATLSKRNLKRVARRSGRSLRELEVMRQVGIKKGKKITVEYDVVPTAIQGDGLKADRVIMGEI